MAGHIQASVVDIVPIIKTRLSAVTGIPEDLILVIGREFQSVPHNQADATLLMKLSAPQPEEGIWDNPSGRLWTICSRILWVHPQIELNIDEADRDEQRLLHPDSGVFVLEEKVVDALHDFFPATAESFLTLEPLHWVPTPVAATEIISSPGRDKQDAAWGSSLMAFTLKYAPKFTFTGEQNL